MAIGAGAAIIGSAVLGAGASALGASRQASAARQGVQAQTQAADQSLALQNQMFQQTRQDFEPFRQLGTAAINPLASLLGLDLSGAPAAQNLPAAANVNTAPAFNQWRAYLDANPDVQSYWNSNPKVQQQYRTPEALAEYHYNTFGRGEGRALPQAPATPAPAVSPPSIGAPAAGVEPGAGMQQIQQTPGYNFLMDETIGAVNADAAARGIRNSGAQQNALSERLSQSLLFPLYQDRQNTLMNLLNVGTGSAAQISGAGQNRAANSGNILANLGQAQAQGARDRASAFNNGLAGVVNNIGGGVGAFGSNRGWF